MLQLWATVKTNIFLPISEQLYITYQTWHSSAMILIASSHLTDRAPITPGTTTRNG